MKTSVEELLLQPFPNRTYEDRLRILRDGKPLDITLLIKTSKNIDITISNVEWLTRCAEGFRLFCWPCLLFAKFVGVWNNTGYTNVSSLNEEVQKHESEKSHIFYDMRLTNILRLINNNPTPLRPTAMVRTSNKDRAKIISSILRGIVDIICSREKLNQASGIPACLQKFIKNDIVAQKLTPKNIQIKHEFSKKGKRIKKRHKTSRSEFKIVPIESLIPTLSQSNLDSENETSSDSHDSSSDEGKIYNEEIASVKQELLHDCFVKDNEHRDGKEENPDSSYTFACPSIKHEALNIEFDGVQPE